jgi:hypothetical protein
MSDMNLAFRRFVAPLMYFGLQGPKWGVDRFDDIWAGFVAKRILDATRLVVWSGGPFVTHNQQSDLFANLEKETPGFKMNRDFWGFCFNQLLVSSNVSSLSTKMVNAGIQIEAHPLRENREYWKAYGRAIQLWAGLFFDAEK